MGLVERLNELESMRQSGQISDSEYAMLVASATKKFSEESELVASSQGEDVTETSQSGIQSNNKKMVGVVLVCVLIVAFLVFGNNSSDEDSTASSAQDSMTFESGTEKTSQTEDSSKANREDAAKACRQEESLRVGDVLLQLSRNIRKAKQNGDSTNFEIENDFVFMQYEDAGSLSNARTWISEEMNAITKYRDAIVKIDRPELLSEKNSLISLLTQLEESQLYLLGAQSWSEFSRLATQYQLTLRGFYDSEFAIALRKLCKG
jgi:hypothetical protein